jgi:hypothetical protein
MTPKVAGTLLAVAGALGAVGSGWLIGNPPSSIVGAVTLTLSTIAVAIGLLMRLRRSWQDPPWPPDRAPNLARIRRLLLINAVVTAIASPLLLGYAAYSAVVYGIGWRASFLAFVSLLAIGQASMSLRGFRAGTEVARTAGDSRSPRPDA